METRQNDSVRSGCVDPGMGDSAWSLDRSDLARSIRRHHRSRLLKRRRLYYFGHLDERQISKLVDTPTPCSCWMCGNPRRFDKHDLTRGEIKADLDLQDALAEI